MVDSGKPPKVPHYFIAIKPESHVRGKNGNSFPLIQHTILNWSTFENKDFQLFLGQGLSFNRGIMTYYFVFRWGWGREAKRALESITPGGMVQPP